MKIATILAIALSAVAPSAFAQNGRASKAQAAYVLCVMSSLNRVDDGRSDAASIAAATQYDCQSQWDAVVNESAAAFDSQKARAFQAAADQRRIELDTQIVERYRRTVRNGGR